MSKSLKELIGELELPEIYPASSHLRIHYSIHSHFVAESNTDLQVELRCALNAVAYRFKGACDAAETFAALVKQFGDAPPQPARYEQDHQLFVAVISGISCIEALHYSLYLTGASFDPCTFQLLANEKSRTRITPENTLKEFRRWDKAPEITVKLASLQQSAAYTKWQRIRNVLSHRLTPGRQISLSVGSSSQASTSRYWKLGGEQGLSISPHTLQEMLSWLALSIESIFASTASWLEDSTSK